MTLGKMELHHGSCESVLPTIASNSIDAVICDPPYGTTQCSWDSVIDLDWMWSELYRVAKPTAPILLFSAQPFTARLIMSNIADFKYSWKWIKNKKTGFLNAKKQPLRQVEEVCVFYRKQPVYNPQKTTGHKPVNKFTKHTGDGTTVGSTQVGFSGGGQTDRYPSDVLLFDVVNNDNSGGDKFHPTQKPVDLMEYLVATHCNPGDTVLDFCMGSGSTGVACRNLGRHFVGIEQAEHYYDVARQRMMET